MKIKVIVVSLVFTSASLFTMETDFGEKSFEEEKKTSQFSQSKAAFSILGVINRFSTPVTLVNLKETDPFIPEQNAMVNPRYVFNVPVLMIQNCAIISPGSEEKHVLQKPFILNYPTISSNYSSLIIAVADKVVKIRTDKRTEIEKIFNLTEIDHTGNTSTLSDVAFDCGDTFNLMVTQDGKITLEKAHPAKGKDQNP